MKTITIFQSDKSLLIKFLEKRRIKFDTLESSYFTCQFTFEMCDEDFNFIKDNF